eukprot:829759-Pleurochrysis_carterae.AAC.2
MAVDKRVRRESRTLLTLCLNRFDVRTLWRSSFKNGQGRAQAQQQVVPVALLAMRPAHPSTDGLNDDVEPHNPKPAEGVARTPALQACTQIDAQPAFAKATDPAPFLDTGPVPGYAEGGCQSAAPSRPGVLAPCESVQISLQSLRHEWWKPCTE